MPVDFSVVIANRGNPQGLWFTVQSCEVNFLGTDLTREYIVVGNGGKENEDTHGHMEVLGNAKLLAHYSHRDEAMSPPSARQYGVQFATGKYLAFFDNHCLLMPDYFKRAALDFEHYGMDELHSTYRYDIHDKVRYHYTLKLANNFWANECSIPENHYKPYRIAMSGHGGFLVRSAAFREVGGYWNGFVGYGGEESYFDLKMALLGKTNWVDPKIEHVHYIGERGYKRHHCPDYYRNMMMAAHIIGGEAWLYKVYESMFKGTVVGSAYPSMYELMEQAYEQSKEHAAWLAPKRLMTLDELLSTFPRDGIAY